MNRDILTKRIEGGWSSTDGRIRAIRDTSLLDSVRSGGSVTMSTTRRTFWTVELLSEDGTVLDCESVDTLLEADEEAVWFRAWLDDNE